MGGMSQFQPPLQQQIDLSTVPRVDRPRESAHAVGDGILSVDDVVRLLGKVVGLEQDFWP